MQDTRPTHIVILTLWSMVDYKFIAMDACLSFGPRKPLNFFGVLHNVRCIYTSHVYTFHTCMESHACSIQQYELTDRANFHIHIHTCACTVH